MKASVGKKKLDYLQFLIIYFIFSVFFTRGLLIPLRNRLKLIPPLFYRNKFLQFVSYMVEELSSAQCCVCKEGPENEDIVLTNPCSHFYVLNAQENCIEYGGMRERKRKKMSML